MANKIIDLLIFIVGWCHP